MNVDILGEGDVERIALSKVCEHIKDDEWCEDGSVRMDIKNLQDQYHQTTVSQINKLWSETDRLDDEIRELRDSLDVKVLQKQVKALQKQAHITTGVVTTMAEMLEKLKEEI